MSEETVAAAVIAALNAGGASAYDVDEIPGANGRPGSLPTRYTEVTVTRRYTPPLRGDAPSMTGYRITTRAVAKNVTDARNLRRLVGLALENRPVVVGGEPTTPVAFETEDPIGPDDGWFSGLTYYTTTL